MTSHPDSPPSSRRPDLAAFTAGDPAYDAATKVTTLPAALLESMKSPAATLPGDDAMVDLVVELDEHEHETVLLRTLLMEGRPGAVGADEPAFDPMEEHVIEVVAVDPIDAVEHEIAQLPRAWKIAGVLVASTVVIAFAVAVLRIFAP